MTGVVKLGETAGQALLAVARLSLERFVQHRLIHLPELTELPTAVHSPGCSFVTLTNNGLLRGCIGATEPRWPLAEDVARHAAAAARDPRFAPVTADELAAIRLEVTVLSPPQTVPYANYGDLLAKLRPGDDGLILIQGMNRSVLLPQVWQRIPDKDEFLAILARKAGVSPDLLHRMPPTVEVQVFQVQHFAEPGYHEPGN